MTRTCVLGPAAGMMLTLAAMGGPLSPPLGPVAPSYKTLVDIEPRTIINAANTPGDANSQFRITTAGSYYLTGNIDGVAGKRGIEIATDHVTIDLNGFTLTGGIGSLSGIVAEGVRNNIVLRNGAVVDWAQDGIDLIQGGEGKGFLVEFVTVRSSAFAGLRAGASAIIRDCLVEANGGTGVLARDASIVTRCTVRSNGINGITLGTAALADECALYNNSAVSIAVGPGSIVRSCEIGLSGGTAVFAGSACMVQGNRLDFCSADGIVVSEACVVTDNYVHIANRGILVTGNFGRIEHNAVTVASKGIAVNGSSNFLARNLCKSNITNWDIAANNKCLVVQAASGAAFAGDAGGTSVGSAHPQANFSQ